MRRRTSRPALAGDSGHRDECRVVLLLPAGVKQAYVLDAAANAPAIKVPPATMLALVLLAALVILLGCAPGWLLRFL